MSFLAPVVGFVAGALGLGAVGTAVAQIAVGVGVSLLANKLAGKRSSGGAAPGGQQLSLKIEPDAERQALFGRSATAGSLVFWDLSGSSNQVLRMVVALADHECAGLNSTIWVDGKQQTWNSGTGEVSGYGGRLKVFFKSGAPGQTADATLVANSAGRWTSAEVGANVCYAIVEATYDAETFPGGTPSIVFIVDGAKLYDPRKDSTAGGSGSHRWGQPSTYEWTDNPAVISYNVLRGFRPGGQLLVGMHTPADAIRFDDFVASANACDELVALFAGGSERRYRCNLIASSFATNADILERVLGTMAGELVEVGGLYRIMAGVSRSIVGSLTDADIIVDRPLSVDPRRPRSELVNAVGGTFSDPLRSYASVPLPIRASSLDAAEDGGIRLVTTLDLSGVTSRSQAQRIMEVERRRARRQMRVTCTLRAKWVGLEPGDWIELTSERRGIEGKTFEVVEVTINEDLSVDVLLQETDAAIDDWTVVDEIADNSVVDLGPGGPPQASVSGFALSTIIFTSGSAGVERPGLIATWTPVTDPTVVSLVLEYRKVGETTAIERQISEPTSGAYRWADGIQSATSYEARVRPVTLPARGTLWTSWAATSGATGQQVVPVAQIATSLPPELVKEISLSDQERFELSLLTAQEAIQGSVSARVIELREDLERVAASVIANSALQSELIRSVRRTVDGTTVSVTELLEVTAGLSGAWSIAIDVNNRVVGAVRLDGSASTSQFTVLADKFVVANPGDPDVVPFVVTPEGIFLDGVVVKDGSITVEKLSVLTLSAITANIGVITAGRLQNAANTTFIDLNTNDVQFG